MWTPGPGNPVSSQDVPCDPHVLDGCYPHAASTAMGIQGCAGTTGEVSAPQFVEILLVSVFSLIFQWGVTGVQETGYLLSKA